jgi:predicted O-methyltransferase YrrM
MITYFNELNKHLGNHTLEAIKAEALNHQVPIITDEGLQLLRLVVSLTKAKKILEIGTAVGYSAINMALLNPDIFVTTIERNELMYQTACENIKKMQLEAQIKVIFSDALEYNIDGLTADYDLLFIDAAKAQYIKFFEKYEKLIKTHGIIVSDNLLFHNLVTAEEEIESKNLRHLVAKIKNYNEWLSQNPKYQTIFLNIGDGMAVSEKL